MTTAHVATYMMKPIATVAGAEEFIRALHADGKLYHFDDNPETIVEYRSGRNTFTLAECDYVRERVAEMFAIKGFDPFELAVELID